MCGKLLQARRTVRSVVLNVSDIFMGHPIIDVIIDVIVDVSWWEVATKIIIWILINILVVVVVGSVSSATSVKAPTMGVTISTLII
jgi:hypothetical protein